MRYRIIEKREIDKEREVLTKRFFYVQKRCFKFFWCYEKEMHQGGGFCPIDFQTYQEAIKFIEKKQTGQKIVTNTVIYENVDKEAQNGT